MRSKKEFPPDFFFSQLSFFTGTQKNGNSPLPQKHIKPQSGSLLSLSLGCGDGWLCGLWMEPPRFLGLVLNPKKGRGEEKGGAVKLYADCANLEVPPSRRRQTKVWISTNFILKPPNHWKRRSSMQIILNRCATILALKKWRNMYQSLALSLGWPTPTFARIPNERKMGGKREGWGKRPKAQPKGKKPSFLVTLPEKICIGTSILAPRQNLKQYTYRRRFPLSRTNFHT